MKNPTLDQVEVTSWIQQSDRGWRGYASDCGERKMFITHGRSRSEAVTEARREARRCAARYLGDWSVMTVESF